MTKHDFVAVTAIKDDIDLNFTTKNAESPSSSQRFIPVLPPELRASKNVTCHRVEKLITENSD